MNSLKRRQFVKANLIDSTIARTGVNESRRQRAAATLRLRKDMAAKNFANRPIDTYQEAG